MMDRSQLTNPLLVDVIPESSSSPHIQPIATGGANSDFDRARQFVLSRVENIPGVLEVQSTRDGIWVLAEGDARWDVFEAEAEVNDRFPEADLRIHVSRAG